MLQEPRGEESEEILSILHDLDQILSGEGAEGLLSPGPTPVQAAEAADVFPPAPAAAAPEAKKPPEREAAPPAPEPAREPAAADLKIELAPREGIISRERASAPPAPKQSEPAPEAAVLPDVPPPSPTQVQMAPGTAALPGGPPPSPTQVQMAPETAALPGGPPPSPTQVQMAPETAALPGGPPPAPVPETAAEAVADPALPEPPPEGTPKEQIRRVGLLHTGGAEEARTVFAAFLTQAAKSISKKPLFLRWVLAQEVSGLSAPAALAESARRSRAVCVFLVGDGWHDSKSAELSKLLSAAGSALRQVAPADAQKKSAAVDIIVDMMLMGGES